jgi:hypothetical protein
MRMLRHLVPIAIVTFTAVAPACADPAGPGDPRFQGMPPGPPPMMHMPMLHPLIRLGMELPALKLDLRLRPEQMPAWDKLEQAVRTVEPPGRSDRERPPPRPPESGLTAVEAVNREAAMLKTLSGKTDAVAAAFADFYAGLDSEQRGLLDRRLSPPRPR